MIKGIISLHYKTLKEVEKAREELYDKYDSVQLVSFPTTQEEGIYIFKVEKKQFFSIFYLKTIDNTTKV